jgi:adenylyltransferase/sulfurtransferase
MKNDLPLEITVEELNTRLAGGKPAHLRLIDCREEDEWRICNIEGAELLPLSRFGEEVQGKLADTSQEIAVYCHHGMRSLRATHWLRQKGYAKTQSVAGGIAAWAERIAPEMARY